MFRDEDLVRLRGESLADVLRALCKKYNHWLNRLRNETLCKIGDGTFVDLTRGEVDYLESLRAIPSERLEACRGAVRVDAKGWLWSRVQLRLEFLFLCKKGP